MSRKVVVLAAALMLCFASAAPAHHSNAAYDLEHQQIVEATVKQVNWTNPHITFVVETDAKDGKQGGFLRKVRLPDGKELTYSLQPEEQ